MAKSDLFTFLDALFTKARPEGTPPVYMMHRFIASDRDYADACRILQRDLRDPAITFKVWQGVLPRGKGAPRFSYVAPKKAPEEEELVKRMMRVRGERREVVEETIELVKLTGKLDALYLHYGIDPETGGGKK